MNSTPWKFLLVFLHTIPLLFLNTKQILYVMSDIQLHQATKYKNNNKTFEISQS